MTKIKHWGLCIALGAALFLGACAGQSSAPVTAPPATVPPSIVPGTTTVVPGPSATSTEIATAWASARSGYLTWGGIVTGLIDTVEPALAPAMTQANATLKAFFSTPVPTDPTKLVQDWPAINAALLTLAPLIEQTFASAINK